MLERNRGESGRPGTAMRTLMLLTYISVFLSGIFVSLLISTARLSGGQGYLDLVSSGRYDAPRPGGGNGTVRGTPGGSPAEEELRRQLLAERRRADDLQRTVAGLQSGDGASLHGQRCMH